jgi:hypothetical protein
LLTLIVVHAVLLASNHSINSSLLLLDFYW